MTRKDYILIARAFNDTRRDYISGLPISDERQNKCEILGRLASYIASELHNENPRFDSDHFLAVVRGEKALTSRPPR